MEQINLPPFYVGQRVVCIEHTPQWVSDFAGMINIKKGDIVTVRGYSKAVGHRGIFFNEIRNKINKDFPKEDGNEGCYNSKHFTPVSEKFESISLSEIAKEESKLISVN